MNKVVINQCYGGFNLSATAIEWLIHQNKPDQKIYKYNIGDYDFENNRRYFKKVDDEEEPALFSLKDFGEAFWFENLNEVERKDNFICAYDIITSRHDPKLIACVETLGDKVNTSDTNLVVIEVDSDRYIINDYDGYESIVTPESIDWITF